VRGDRRRLRDTYWLAIRTGVNKTPQPDRREMLCELDFLFLRVRPPGVFRISTV